MKPLLLSLLLTTSLGLTLTPSSAMEKHGSAKSNNWVGGSDIETDTDDERVGRDKILLSSPTNSSSMGDPSSPSKKQKTGFLSSSFSGVFNLSQKQIETIIGLGEERDPKQKASKEDYAEILNNMSPHTFSNLSAFSFGFDTIDLFGN